MVGIENPILLDLPDCLSTHREKDTLLFAVLRAKWQTK